VVPLCFVGFLFRLQLVRHLQGCACIPTLRVGLSKENHLGRSSVVMRLPCDAYFPSEVVRKEKLPEFTLLRSGQQTYSNETCGRESDWEIKQSWPFVPQSFLVEVGVRLQPAVSFLLSALPQPATVMTAATGDGAAAAASLIKRLSTSPGALTQDDLAQVGLTCFNHYQLMLCVPVEEGCISPLFSCSYCCCSIRGYCAAPSNSRILRRIEVRSLASGTLSLSDETTFVSAAYFLLNH
jgi:hypothetical protein